MPQDPKVPIAIDTPTDEPIIPRPSYTVGGIVVGVNEDGQITLGNRYDDRDDDMVADIAEAVCVLALLPSLIEAARTVAGR